MDRSDGTGHKEISSMFRSSCSASGQLSGLPRTGAQALMRDARQANMFPSGPQDSLHEKWPGGFPWWLSGKESAC